MSASPNRTGNKPVGLYEEAREITLGRVAESMQGLTFERPPTPFECVDLFCIPVRTEPARKERALLESGERFSFDSHGEQLAAWKWGEGPPVAFAHGWSGHAAQLVNFIEAVVGAGFTAISFDAPAHGISEGSQSTGIRMAESLLALDQEFGPFAGLVAYSFGTAGSTMALARGLRAAKAAYLAPMCWIDLRVEQFARVCGVEDLDAMWAECDRRWGEGRLRQYAGNVLCEATEAPLLVIHDQNDADLDVRNGQALAEAWPNSELVLTEGLGHARLIRDRGVAQRVVDFLRT